MTSEQYDVLTPIEQRIKVAELCGWSEFDYKFMNLTAKTIMGSTSVPAGTPPEGKGRVDCERPHEPLPDYLNDLNAMNKAVLSLPYEDLILFGDNLGLVVYGKGSTRNDWDYPEMIMATVSQRAKAFVLTMTKGDS